MTAPDGVGLSTVHVRPGYVVLCDVGQFGTGLMWSWCISLPDGRTLHGLGNTADEALDECRQVLSRVVS